MNMRYFFAAVVTLSFLTLVARADVQVGDKPTLSFKEFQSHKSIDLADYKNKILVVDFWATWCEPCMAEAEHMVSVNQKYSSKGVQFIGISLDDDPAALTKIIGEKKFTWPQSYQGQGWDGSTPKSWGVTSIPQTFIIGPDGDVLWRGHPAEIDAPLESALKNHPPQLVDPKVLQQARVALDQTDKALAQGQPAAALKLLAGVPDAAKLDAEVAGRASADSDKLQQFGNTELAGIDSLVQSQQYAVAIQKLRDLSNAFAGTTVAAAAKTKLNELGSNPKVKATLDAEKTEKEAADALVIARQLKSAGKDDLAYPQFQTVVKGYPHTAAATDAAVVVKAYESNTAFMTAYNNKANTKKAESLLLLADNYRLMGSGDKAREKYQQVIDQFPGTAWAVSAKKGIAAVGDGQ